MRVDCTVNERTARLADNVQPHVMQGVQGAKVHVRGIGVHGWNGTPTGTGTYENKERVQPPSPPPPPPPRPSLPVLEVALYMYYISIYLQLSDFSLHFVGMLVSSRRSSCRSGRCSVWLCGTASTRKQAPTRAGRW